MQDNQQWELPQKYWCYKRSFEVLYESRQLFRKLFLQYHLCIKCIFRIYSLEHTKLFSDSAFYLEILPILLEDNGQCEILNRYNVQQCGLDKICWLCQQIFQKSYIGKIINDCKRMIEQKGYQQWQQYKLNIRMPNIIFLKNLILARFIYHEQSKKGATPQYLQRLYNILIVPFESNKYIDPKTVLKWILSNQLNQSTNMTSTSDENEDNLIVNIQLEYQDSGCQSHLMKSFSSYLGLEKKKEKTKGRKTCIDLGSQKQEKQTHHQYNQVYKCNAYNMNKILTLKQKQFDSIFEHFQGQKSFWKYVLGNDELPIQDKNYVTHKLSLHTKNVYLCGRYIKFSRYLSQTPWIVMGKKLSEGSLQQEIEDKIYKLFFPNKNKEQIQIRFHSGGREDIDVRMLKGGRPFVLQFVNPIRSIKTLKESDIFALVPQHGKQAFKAEYQKWLNQQKQCNNNELHSWRIAKLLEILINYENSYVQVLEFQETTESFISVQLKAAETQKIKHYLCYIYSMQPLTEEDKNLLNNLKNIPLEQLTPIRVLHRRTLLNRDKMIHRLKMHLVSAHSAILQVWASAGTYIKEFVHGDLGRTTPNVGSILQKQIDILQLDVGSLKEGEWKDGDQQLMKMDKFQWMD